MTTLEPLSDHVFLIQQHALNIDVRGAVIVGEDKAVVFDTLVLPEELSVISNKCEGREILVVYSHADWDHVWGTCALNYKEVIAHRNCAKRFADPKDVTATLKDYQAKHPEELSDIKLIAPTQSFDDTLTLELGGVSVELSYLAGHTLDGIVAFVPEDGVLLAGDAVETAMPIIYEDTPLSSWIHSLETWLADERVKTVVPSHGEIQGASLLSYNIAYLKAMQAAESIDIPYEMDDFYINVHAKNQQLAPKLT